MLKRLKNSYSQLCLNEILIKSKENDKLVKDMLELYQRFDLFCVELEKKPLQIEVALSHLQTATEWLEIAHWWLCIVGGLKSGISVSTDCIEEAATKFFQALRKSDTKKANYYVNKHNKIAQAYGISYHFSLPESSTDSFTRTIEDVSLMAIFQGYPYGKGTDDVYSRFSVSGARIYRGGRFYVMPASDGVSYYHRSDCPELEGSRSNYQVFDSKKQCAEFGAYPCPKCKP